MKTEKKDTKKVKNPVPQEPKPERMAGLKAFFKNETMHFILGLALALMSAFAILAFVQYFLTGGADQSVIESAGAEVVNVDEGEVQNATGIRGAQLADYFINKSFGAPIILMGVFFLVAGLKLMRVVKVRLWKWFIGCSLLMIWLSVFFGFLFKGLYEDSFFYLGGLHGYNVSDWLEQQVGVPGLLMILFFTAICLLIYFSTQTVIWIRKLLGFGYLKRKKKENPEDAENPEKPENGEPDDVQEGENPEQEEIDEPFDDPKIEPINLTDTDDDVFTVVAPEDDELEDNGQRSTENDENDSEFIVDVPKDEKPIQLEPYNPRLDLSHYEFPTLDLMKHFDNDGPSVDMDEQQANKKRIEDVLRSFGIEIKTITATVGPTITLYEITLKPGIKISKVRSLEDDIALSLAADGIRIIAPIPGRGTIGIEVPNANPQVVSMESILNSKKFKESKMALPLALGKTISNEIYMVDLAKIPHLLVAGATGQGKSVGLNAIITSLLYKKHPAELKFVLVDPKMVEFSIYKPLTNHFLAQIPPESEADEPIITDVTKVVKTLNSVCQEMDDRYNLLKQANVRKLEEYNEKFTNRELNPELGHRYLPYIVVFIDEYGDLIMTAGKEIELPIARIAQKARAVGIHMIIATQRPTTNIITGTIKANFPGRMAFKVMSQIDSRTILDGGGANQLIGRGDMLILDKGTPVRVQCAFVDTPEVIAINEFIAEQPGYDGPFELPEPIVNDEGGGGNSEDLSNLDQLFGEAARVIVSTQQGSTSLIQRKFSIGYNRAGRLMDQLEKAGVVGAAHGSKPREVLIQDENTLQSLLNTLGTN